MRSAYLNPEIGENKVYLNTILHRRLHNFYYYAWINAEMESVLIIPGDIEGNQSRVKSKLRDLANELRIWSIPLNGLW